jgi:elongation factor P
MASTADFKNGMCIEFKNDLFTIIQFQHVKPGKGPAFVRTKLKSVNTGKVIDNTFTSGLKVTEARIERRPHQYLYKDDMGFNFMDNSNFEQVALQESSITNAKFLKEGDQVDVVYHADNEEVLFVELPAHVVLEVTYTEPGVKGDTATNTLKPATTDSGAEIMVPLFINAGDKVKVDTRDGSYCERVKA